MGEVRALLWDVGGTLMDWRAGGDAALAEAVRDCGLDPALLTPARIATARAEYEIDEPNWRTAADEGAGCLRHAEALLRGTEALPAAVARLGERLVDYFDAYAPVAGIPELLRDIASRGIAQGVVSNWPPSLRRFLAHHNLAQYFQTIVCSAELGVLKPDPRPFQCALHALNITAAQTVFVGNDLKLDIEPAMSLGMRTIHFDPRRQCRASAAQAAPALREQLLKLL